MRVAYFVHELADPAVQRRVRQLETGGATVTRLGFERMRFQDDAANDAIVLGRTESGKFAARALSVLLAIPKALKARASWTRADVLVARNLEMLMLACAIATLAGSRQRIAYECLDIHRLMLGSGPVSVMLRALERIGLKRASLLVTSSPGFVTHYFASRQSYRGHLAIIENKPANTAVDHPAAPAPHAPPWRIAWCGVLRCAKSFTLLEQLAQKLGPLVEIDLWGVVAEDQIPDAAARMAALANLRFHGRYKASDLSLIYGGAHFVWAIDYYEAGGNSDWLLPNRLYEGLAHGVVPIAVEGVETARWLKRHCVGRVLVAPLDKTLEHFVRTLSIESYTHMRAAVDALPPSAVRFTSADARALVDALSGVAMSNSAAAPVTA